MGMYAQTWTLVGALKRKTVVKIFVKVIDKHATTCNCIIKRLRSWYFFCVCELCEIFKAEKEGKPRNVGFDNKP